MHGSIENTTTQEYKKLNKTHYLCGCNTTALSYHLHVHVPIAVAKILNN